MDTKFFTILSSLIKPRDYLFTGFPMISTFIIESIDENVIEFMSSGNSAVIAGAIGMTINKSIVEYIIKNKKKKFTKTAASSFVSMLDEKLNNETMLLTQKENVEAIKRSLESLIERYDKKILTYDEFHMEFAKLKEIDITR